MLTVSRITHVAIRVKDIEATLDFYVSRLGFERLMHLDRDGRLWLVYLRITDTQYLEVFPEGEGDEAPGATWVGYNHLCLEVPDIKKAVEELDAVGIERIRPTLEGADGNWQTWIQDPDGHRIEIMEMSPTGMQARALKQRGVR